MAYQKIPLNKQISAKLLTYVMGPGKNRDHTRIGNAPWMPHELHFTAQWFKRNISKGFYN